MPINILMPALSPTMTEGKLAKWLVNEGDAVASGEAIAEIETDKATMEVEAVDEGTLGKILVAEGTDNVPVNRTIAVLLEDGEDADSIDASAGVVPVVPAPAASGVPRPAPVAGAGRILASPLAKRMAAQSGLDIGAIKGSGPNGRVVKRDVEAAIAGGVPAAAAPQAAVLAAAPAVAAPMVASGPSAKALADMLGMGHRQEPLSNMRKTIAARLTEAKQTVPHFYLTVDCALDALLKVRAELNSRAEASGGGYKVSVNDFVIRAAALALKKVPAANASFDPEGMLFYDHADVSVAVATPAGLITPIVKAAETKGLAEISAEMKDLAARARDGKLKPEEYQGGTFSVSNLGMFGVREFAAIVNPPQGAILAVGAGEQRPVVKDGALAVATVMSCTLSVDHRAIDGAVGAAFLAAFKPLIEDPLTMLL